MSRSAWSGILAWLTTVWTWQTDFCTGNHISPNHALSRLSEVAKLAQLGGGGKFPGNTHRDLLQMVGKPILGLASSHIYIRLQSGEGKHEDVKLQFLLPHKFFAALYHSTPEAFKTSVLGGDAGKVAKFWRDMQNHPNVLARPHLSPQSGTNLSKVVPIAIHGDGVAYMKVGRAGGKSLEVLSWSSLLTQGPTKTNSFLMFLVCKHVVKDYGVFQTWARAWKVLIWSLQALASGTWPLTDWDKKEFDEDTMDFQLKGQPLAQGYSAVVFVLRSDLEFLSNHFKLNHPGSNSPCALCQADRDTSSRPWTDCRACASWQSTIWKPSEWLEAHPSCHPFFSMHGSGIDLVFPDLMHCKHLGTDQVLLGSILIWMTKRYLGGRAEQNLAMVWDFIQRWYKEQMLGL